MFLAETKDDFDPRQTCMLMQDAFDDDDDDNGTFSLRLIQFLE
jgi:hypothetical protein